MTAPPVVRAGRPMPSYVRPAAATATVDRVAPVDHDRPVHGGRDLGPSRPTSSGHSVTSTTASAPADALQGRPHSSHAGEDVSLEVAVVSEAVSVALGS